MEMRVIENKSRKFSLSNGTLWKLKLRIIIESAIHSKVTRDGKNQPIWDVDFADEIRKKVDQETAEALQNNSNAFTTDVMKAARYGNYIIIEQQVKSIPIEPAGGKTILHMILDGMIASKYKDNPSRICVENIIAGKDVCDSVIDAYFPPEDSTTSGQNSDHYKCFDFILKNIPSEELNKLVNLFDDAGNSALHYAVAWSETTVIKALLQAGAYSCRPNKNGIIPLKIINPQVLGEYLDSCVLSNDYPVGHKDFQIYFNYQLFIPPKKQESAQDGNGIEAGPKELQYYGSRESEPLFVLHDRPDWARFLTHPVIRNYFCLKWIAIKKYSYIEYILFTWFFSLVSLYLFLNCLHIYTPSLNCPSDFNDTLAPNHKDYNCCNTFIKNIDHERKFNLIVYPMSSIFVSALVTIRVILLVFIVHRYYYSSTCFALKSKRIWLQMMWVLYIFSLRYINGDTDNILHLYLVIMIITLSIEYVLVLGRSPEHSMHIEMVKVFVINVCKYLLEFFVVILFLAISFVVFFNTGHNSKTSNKTVIPMNEACISENFWTVNLNKNNASGNEIGDRPFPLYIMETFIIMLRGDPQVRTFMPNDDLPLSHALFLLYCFIVVYAINNLMIVVPNAYASQVVNEAKSIVIMSFLKFIWYVETAAIRDPTQLLDLLNKLSLWAVFFCRRWCLRSNPKPPEPFWKRISVTYAMPNSRKEPFRIRNEKTFSCLNYESEIFENAVKIILNRTRQQNEIEKKLCESESRLEKVENSLLDTQLGVYETLRAVHENQLIVQDIQGAVREYQRSVQENQRIMQENEEKLRKDLLNSYKEVIARLESLQTPTGVDPSSSGRKFERRNTE